MNIAPLAPAVVIQVLRYRSKILTGDDAAVLVPQVRDAAFQCEPPTKAEALALMSNVCRFLAGVLAESPGLPRELDSLLTEARIVWWSNHCLAAGESRKTIAVQIPRLRRMRRVLDGLPARMRVPKTVRPLPDAPLDTAELQRLADTIGDCPARSALAAAVGAGLVGRAAVGGVMTHDSVVHEFVTADGARWQVPPGLNWLAASVIGEVVPAEGWAAVTAAAKRCGVTFNRVVAAQTRRLAVFAVDAPSAGLIQAFRVDHKGLARIAAHVPAVSDADRVRWLRGEEGERDCTAKGAEHLTSDPGIPGDEGSRQ